MLAGSYADILFEIRGKIIKNPPWNIFFEGAVGKNSKKSLSFIFFFQNRMTSFPHSFSFFNKSAEPPPPLPPLLPTEYSPACYLHITSSALTKSTFRDITGQNGQKYLYFIYIYVNKNLQIVYAKEKFTKEGNWAYV